VDTRYKNIFDLDYFTSQKGIEQVKAYILKAKREGKKIRGAALRHSWSSIFADEGQYLISMYPHKIAVGSSEAVEAYSNDIMENKRYEVAGSLVETRIIAENYDGDNTLVKVGAAVSN
jgi:hypothetical protein